MRIGIEAQRLFRSNKHGMDIVALELIKALQQIDHENQYFIFVKPDSDNTIIIENPNFHVIYVESGPYPWWEQVTLPNSIKEYNLDLLHCTANTAPLRTNIPLVLTLHDIIFLENLNLTKGSRYQRFGNIYRRLIVPRLIDKVAEICTVSNSENKIITEYFNLPNSRVSTLYNGVGKHFRPITDPSELSSIRKKYNLPENFIFCFGNRDPRKNSKNILHAYSLLLKKNYNLPLFMPDINKGYLNRICNELGIPEIKDHIIRCDYIHNTDLPPIYSTANLFLFPSTRESFGIPVLESMACGTPVLTSNISSLPEVAGNAALLVDPNNPQAICNGMIDLIENHELKTQLIDKGFIRAQKFSWENTAKEFLKIYDRVANK